MSKVGEKTKHWLLLLNVDISSCLLLHHREFTFYKQFKIDTPLPVIVEYIWLLFLVSKTFIIYIFIYLFFKTASLRQCWSLGDRGQVQPGWCTANHKPAGVRPITRPLRSEQKHKETKMFGAITAAQRGTCLVLIVYTYLVTFRGGLTLLSTLFILRKYYFLANCMQSSWKTWSHSVINIIILHFM